MNEALADTVDERVAEEHTGGEYERQRVPDKALLGAGKFWGMYAGEHAAGTEFMIGPLFLAAGASLADLILGLLLGNILAVLTWRYLVTPIAIAKRFTLYYQLERIAGGSLVKLYNVVNGVLFCFLAGAMVTVSASAVGVPFDIHYAVPEQTFGFGAPSFTALVVVVGIVDDLHLCCLRNRLIDPNGSDQQRSAFRRQILERCGSVCPSKEW